MHAPGVRRAAAVALTFALLGSACSGGGDDSLETGGRSSDGSESTVGDRERSTTSTTVVEVVESDSAGGPTGERHQRLRAYYQSLRNARRRHAEQAAADRAAQEAAATSTTTPPPPPPPDAPPPPPPPPPPVDPMIARRAAYAELCAVEEELGLIEALDGLEPDVKNLVLFIEPLTEFFERGRGVAPAELEKYLVIIEPVALQLTQALADYDELGIEPGSERWVNGVLTLILEDPKFLDSVGRTLGAVQDVCR